MGDCSDPSGIVLAGLIQEFPVTKGKKSTYFLGYLPNIGNLELKTVKKVHLLAQEPPNITKTNKSLKERIYFISNFE